MAARKRKLFRLYTRGPNDRFYADFSQFSDVIEDDPRVALKPEGAKLATTDPELAEEIALDFLEEYRERRRRRRSEGRVKRTTLGAFAEHHLKEKERAGRVTDAWLKACHLHLDRAVAFFGAETDPRSISVSDVRRWVQALSVLSNGQGGTLGEGSQLQHLNSLSNLYRRAQAEEVVPPGFNPVASLMEKPQVERREAEWLEVDEAARFLAAARL